MNIKVILEMQQKFQKGNLNGMTGERFQSIFCPKRLRVLYTHRAVSLKHQVA